MVGLPRVPVSTYRLQFHSAFTFAEARELVPYLAALGVTDCYSSPYLKARPGSAHGYDICDHNQLNPEIGSEADYDALTAELRRRDMGLILDWVPNHMGVQASINERWRDVLENGRCSPHARFFDIDWSPVKDELEERILLPILGDQYGRVLERGELRLAFDGGAFSLRYFDHDLPINPRQFPRLLEHDLDRLRAQLGEADADLAEYLSIATGLRNLPHYTDTEPEHVMERHREKEVAKERLRRLVEASPAVRAHIEAAVLAFNGRPGAPESFDQLHQLLELQPYRLSYWRTASHEINYRRFFDINELAGIRMDDPEVFRATHGLVLRLIGEGKITGLRLDHIDGLFDPLQYLTRLQTAIAAVLGGSRQSAGESAQALYVVVEKILSPGEVLPAHWPVAGTSGYDFLNQLNGVFIDGRSQRSLARIYRRFTHLRTDYRELVYETKRLITDTSMASELNVLAHALNRISESDRRTRDFTLNSLREALREIVACFPIYRTYVSPDGFTDADREAILTAVGRARRRNPSMERSIFDFAVNVLLPDLEAKAPESRRQCLNCAMKFQQYTGPVQAKGAEDTAFYRYNMLASLNEVGGDPQRFGLTPQAFHELNLQRRQDWPLSMLGSATHDTKRGEDVRARLNALAEIPDEWGRQLTVWARTNAAHRSEVDGEPAPDRNDEYLFYQTLLGTWPPGAAAADGMLIERLQQYMCKAVKEAKVHTSWVTENQAYEAALARFVERVLAGPTSRRFLGTFLPFQARLARLGMINSLSQLVLKVVSPGVPDFYQGTELWDLSLVDPDNRRPVDYQERRRMLGDLESLLAEEGRGGRGAALREMLEHWEDGRIKLFITAASLRLRRALAPLFHEGSYEALDPFGEGAHHVVAVARRHRGTTVIAAVTRLSAALTRETPLPIGADVWGNTRLPLPFDIAGARDILSGTAIGAGSSLALAEVFAACPVAILVGEEEEKM